MSELQAATGTVQRMSSAAGDKGIPNEVLENAKCVAVIPKLVKGAFVVGGEHGTGVATCRLPNNSWSPPAPFSVSGLSWGAQIGSKSTDLLMFIMNEKGMNDLISGHFKVGADVSAAAGPVGRTASAEAGWKAGILTYSSSKGAFIGASLNGAELQQDHRATQPWYGPRRVFPGHPHRKREDAQRAGAGVRERSPERERERSGALRTAFHAAKAGPGGARRDLLGSCGDLSVAEHICACHQGQVKCMLPAAFSQERPGEVPTKLWSRRVKERSRKILRLEIAS